MRNSTRRHTAVAKARTRRGEPTFASSERRWLTWILIGWLSVAGFGLAFAMRMMSEPVSSAAREVTVNPVFDAVMARDVERLVAMSDDLDPAWLDAANAGMTPVMQASSFGDVEMVETLLRFGADPNKRGSASRTALQYAAEKNRLRVARALVSAGADVDGADVSGLTPLIMAADRGYTDFGLLMLESGANVNATMKNGWTALLDAGRRGNLTLARELLARGADANARVNGNSPLRLAEQNGHTEVAALVKRAGGTR
ncbi:MAG: ankyrin repeat domain-containing protein [Pseudomonadota bacterium]